MFVLAVGITSFYTLEIDLWDDCLSVTIKGGIVDRVRKFTLQWANNGNS